MLLAWRPDGAGEEIHPADDTIYYAFYKLLFALDPRGHSVRWVHQHEHDIAGLAALPGGVMFADVHGNFRQLAASDGLPVWERAAEREALVITFSASDMVVTRADHTEPRPIRDRFLEIASCSDARLVPGCVLAVQSLAALPEEEATDHLIGLCQDARVSQAVRGAACELLPTRENGADAVIAALDMHASYLHQIPEPAVGPLSRAAAALDGTDAVPLLIDHLNDPSTSEADLADIARALSALGDRSAVEPLLAFLRLYHADAPTDALVAALGAVADAVLALAGADAEEPLSVVADSPLCTPALRDVVLSSLDAHAARLADAEATPSEGGDGGDGSAGWRPQSAVAASAALIEQALAPVATDLVNCLGGRVEPAGVGPDPVHGRPRRTRRARLRDPQRPSSAAWRRWC